MALPSPLDLPLTLRPIAHFLKIASEYENRDPVISYWCRLAALQAALKLDKKSPEAVKVLVPLMDWLEKVMIR
jgi:vacuolar protein sorting-associated protein VTA1